MSTEGFFDQVARTLAEPMPRRRAVRVIGASLAALAVPGVSPRMAQAAALRGISDGTCAPNSGRQQCSTYIDPNNWPKGMKYQCCPYPANKWRCGSDGWTCTNVCVALPGKAGAKATWSTEKKPEGTPKRYDCCQLPDTVSDGDGRCLPNCSWNLNRWGGKGHRCGETCCHSFEICVKGTCRSCQSLGGDSCQPAKTGGTTICCAKGTNCCFNNTSTACCGPKQTCKTSKGATCVCEDGKKCGTDCCKKGEICLGSECCTADRLCPTGQTANTCCSGENEYCFFKADPDLTPLGGKKLRAIGTCKEGCAPGNTAGRQCCGTGFKPNRRKTRCVPE